MNSIIKLSIIHNINYNKNSISHLYSSRPPFVFFFNPTIQLQQFTEYGCVYHVGYGIKNDDDELVSIDFES